MKKRIECPIEAISGLIKNVKKKSVELQHETWKFIFKNMLIPTNIKEIERIEP
ncbi:hypothetical protein HY498_03130 [Candidatus Woesearchaeota archaeon]|nr:hypothetical protein [Candidatus Woesearchaeota archaeon]